jgi:hypothetical protein
MRRVEFVDTSILVEILNIPGMNSRRRQVLADFDRRRKDSAISLILPTAAVIETGNHIHHIGDGRARRRCAEAFAGTLRLTMDDQAPWTLHGAHWDATFLGAICSGAGTGSDFVEHATRQDLSCGDLSVVAERDEYRRNLAKGIDVVIWTLDAGMSAWS